jgi:hypothetical protein
MLYGKDVDGSGQASTLCVHLVVRISARLTSSKQVLLYLKVFLLVLLVKFFLSGPLPGNEVSFFR